MPKDYRVDFVRVKCELMAENQRWDGVGHWVLPDTTTDALGFIRAINAAFLESVRQLGLTLYRFNWRMTIQVITLYDQQAAKVMSIVDALDILDAKHFAWVPRAHPKGRKGKTNGEV